MQGIKQAKVKNVLSGDTLVLTSLQSSAEERTLSLAFVSAPRLRREGDELFAFQSREFLRAPAIGKVVQFKVLYSIPTGVKRDYGIVYLQSGDTFPDVAVREGWVKLREDAGRKDDSDESKQLLERLEVEQDKAKASSKGIWSSSGGKIDNSYELPDPKAFAEQWKGKRIDAIIERVFSGDRMIARLELSETKHVQTMVLVAGIRAPSTKRTNPTDGKEIPAEPFGTEAHQFVEERMLLRRVTVEVLGISPQNQLVCAVIHPNGSIAKFILEAGLARCTDHHSTMLGGQMSELRQAEKRAKEKGMGVFQGAVSSKPGAAETDAIISRVQTADTIYLRGKSGDERRVQLSSVRQPKPTDPKQAPFQADAKEFLRKKLIGKHVRVTVDGKKAASEGFEERDVVTIVVNNKNIALQLVEAGYASVIRHRRDDDDRSPAYDELLAAEEVAQKEEKGMWSPKPPATKNYQDYSETLQKAKIQSSVLQRQKKIPAIVDFVKGGSRFTILIPRENAKLTFVLSCVRTPRSARNASEKSEPFGQEAHDFANRRCLQRDVEIDVEATDKVGGFIGTLYVNRENFAKLLLEEGLASVHAYSAEQSAHGPELFAAEDRAKKAKKRMWHDYDPSITDSMDALSFTDNTQQQQQHSNGTTTTTPTPSNPPKKDYRDVLITHIDPTTARLKLQIISPSTTTALTTLMSSFSTHHRSPISSLPTPPKTGDLISARYSLDNEWYRARIRRNDRENKKSDVLFIDYGNSETLPWTHLRPLPTQFSTQKLKPQAIDAAFSFLQFPRSSEFYLADSCAWVEARTAGKQLVASVDAEERDGMLWVTLFDPETEAETTKEEKTTEEGGTGGKGVVGGSINEEIVAEGLATVKRDLRGWEIMGRDDVVRRLRERMAEAREEKRGVWEYGEVEGEDD